MMRHFLRSTAMMALLAMVCAFPALHGQAQDPFDELEKEISSSQDSQEGKTAAERYGEYKQDRSAEYEAYREKLLAEYEKYRQIEREEQELPRRTSSRHTRSRSG